MSISFIAFLNSCARWDSELVLVLGSEPEKIDSSRTWRAKTVSERLWEGNHKNTLTYLVPSVFLGKIVHRINGDYSRCLSMLVHVVEVGDEAIVESFLVDVPLGSATSDQSTEKCQVAS